MRPALIGLLLLATGPLTLAEEPAAAPPTLSVSRDLGLHAYPAKDQVAAQQQKDEVECYRWAAQDSGFNPLAAVGEQPRPRPPPAARRTLPRLREGQRRERLPAPRRVRSSAPLPATRAREPGSVPARASSGVSLIAKHKQKEAQKEADAEPARQQAATKAETQQKLEGFKKAYGACMEAKSYVVK